MQRLRRVEEGPPIFLGSWGPELHAHGAAVWFGALLHIKAFLTLEEQLGRVLAIELNL